MKYLSLPNSTKQTTQLGFGCAFWSSVDESAAGRILDAAYDAGIRHFDVAPIYADGAAEGYVGKALARHQDITVTTKYGLLPSADEAAPAKLMRLLLKPANRALRMGIPLPFQAGIAAISRRKASYTVEEMQRSLARSATLLKRDHIDLFLFHEPDRHDLEDRKLIDAIRKKVAEGRVGAVGIGTQSPQARDLFQTQGKSWDVMQYDWNAFSGAPLFPNLFQVTYWVTGRSFQDLQRSFLADDGLVRHWSDSVGLDLHQPDTLRKLLLKAALLANGNGITLVYSSNPEHIHQNAAACEDASLERSARTFLDLAQAAGSPKF